MKVYRFGPFELQPQRCILLRERVLVPLAPKTVALLRLLVENAGDVVSKEEIHDGVWSGVVVDDSSIAKNISLLRRELRTHLDDPEPIQTVAKRGYQFTAAVMVEETADTAPDPIEAPTPPVSPLGSEAAAPGVQTEAHGAPHRAGVWQQRSAAFTTLLLLGLASVLAVVTWLLVRRPAEQHSARRSVAILPFANLTGSAETAWFSTALRETLVSEMESGEKLHVIPSDDTDTMVRDLRLSPGVNLSAAVLGRIRSNLNCDYVVEGTYLRVEDALRVDVYLQDTQTGKTITHFTQTRPAAELLSLISDTGGNLRSALSIGPMSGGPAVVIAAALPVNAQALRFYSEGLARLRVWDATAALPLLQQSNSIDATNPAIHSALADTYSMMGDDAKAAIEAQSAFTASAHLPREQRLVIEGRAEQATRQWDKAIATQTTLHQLFPDDDEYSIRLAQVLLLGGKPKDALAVITRIEQSEAANDPRVFLEEASIQYQLGDFADVRRAAEHAQQLAQAQDAHILLGRALTLEGDALVHIGSVAEARTAFGKARSIAESYDDKVGLMHALRRDGGALRDSDPQAALPLFQQECRVAQQAGDAREFANCRIAIGFVHYRLGELQEAVKVFDESLKLSRQLPDKRLILVCLEALTGVHIAAGEWPEAQAALDEALPLSEEMKSASMRLLVQVDQALLAAGQGELTAARARLENAAQLARAGKDAVTMATIDDALASVMAAQGDYPAASAALQQECALWSKSGHQLGLAKCQIDSAQLALAAHDLAQAKQWLSTATFNADAVDPAAEAHRVHAGIALQEGDLKAATMEVAALQPLEKRAAGQLPLVLDDEILRAQVEAASGQSQGARLRFGSVIHTTEEHHFVKQNLEARLALLKLSRKGDPARSGGACKTLVKEALASGYKWVAQEAGPCHDSVLQDP